MGTKKNNIICITMYLAVSDDFVIGKSIIEIT